MTTEIDPSTLKLVNHDAERTAKKLAEVMEAAKAQFETSNVHQPELPAASMESIDPAPVIASDPVVEPTNPEPANAPSSEEWEALMEQNRIWKKKALGAQGTLTPIQQKAALLEKELRAEREKSNAVIQELKNSIGSLVEEIKNLKTPKEPVYDPDRDPELDQIDPVMADRFRKMNRSSRQQIEEIERRHAAELAAIREQETKRQKDIEATEATRFQAEWESVFSRLVPDWSNFVTGSPMGQSLFDWACKVAPEYANAVLNPYTVSPPFLANVINTFKSSMNAPVAKKPSLGDIANPQLTGSAPLRQTAPEPERLCTEYEMQNVRKIHEDLCRKHKMAEADDLLERYQRTLSKR